MRFMSPSVYGARQTNARLGKFRLAFAAAALFIIGCGTQAPDPPRGSGSAGSGGAGGRGIGPGAGGSSGAPGGGGTAGGSGPGAGGQTAGPPDGGAGGAAGGGTPDAGGDTPQVAEVSKTCIDGMYSEVLPTTDRSIADLISGYTVAGFQSFVSSVLERRYPPGKNIIDGALMIPDQCLDFFIGSKDTAANVLDGLPTAVHECGHALDGARSQASGGSSYVFTATLTITAPGGGDQGMNPTFARSRIRGDGYAARRPPCPTMGPNGCDTYADTYLTGNPDDSMFDSGDQGFNMLLEEMVQYTNSLAGAYALKDQHQSGNSSDKDGILTLMWWVERYLAMARKTYPADYDFLSKDANWQKAILTAWGRAWLYLQATESIAELGIDDAQIFPLVRDPALLGEIDLIRKAAGCP